MNNITEREARYLRRDNLHAIIKRENRKARIAMIAKLIAAVAGVALITMSFWPLLAAEPVAYTPVITVDGVETDLVSLCAQYRSDKLMTGEPMSEEMTEMCKF